MNQTERVSQQVSAEDDVYIRIVDCVYSTCVCLYVCIKTVRADYVHMFDRESIIACERIERIVCSEFDKDSDNFSNS